MCRGVQAEKEEEEKVEETRESLEDQGGVIEAEDQEDEIEDDTHDSPEVSPSSKFVLNKFNNKYDKQEDKLDGSTVVIADVTPEEVERNIPSSPVIDQETKDKLRQLGQSLDSKQIKHAIGNIDMRRL